MIKASASKIIDAPAETIYAVIADYHHGHAAILPKPFFQSMTVVKGGIGTGTEVITKTQAFGQRRTYHQRVSEPVPGRVIQEADIHTGQWSRFRLEPQSDGRTRVTIDAELPPNKGIMGLIERLTAPPVMAHMFRAELDNLAHYVRTDPVSAP